MRVVAGSARGRTLVGPPGTSTRPTTDKVRQAIFNSLESMDLIEGARLLDLFAGSGALGIEGLSRGAAHCTFVESDRTAVRVIDDNRKVVAETDCVVLCTTVDRFLTQRPDQFDVALVDPPYPFDDWPNLLNQVPAPFVVIESDRKVDPGPGWAIVRSKAYGSTVVVFAQRTEPVTE